MNAVTKVEDREAAPLVKLATQLEQRAVEFQKALPSHISPDKLQRTIITAAQTNPDLLTADRQSLIVAAMKAAQDGLLPDGREAALVIYNNRVKGADGQFYNQKVVQYLPMVYGLRKKIVQSGEISTLTVGIVYRCEYESGRFLYEEGTEAMLRHKPMLEMSSEQATDSEIVAFYSIARMKDGSLSYDVMSRAKVDRIRELSQTGAIHDRWGKPRTPKGPWVDHYGEMGCKTVMRHHSKVLPMSGDLIIDVEGREQEMAERAVHLLSSVDAEAPVALPTPEELASQVEHDQETGEIIDQPTAGPTEVDEETARELDARAGNESENPVPEPEQGGIVEGEADEKPAWFAKVQSIRNGIAAAKNKQGVKSFDDEFTRIRAALPDEIVDELDDLVAARRAALTKAAANAEAGA